MDAILDKLIPYCRPFRLKANVMNSAQKISSLEDMFVYGEDKQAVTVQCYHVTAAKTPTKSLDWHQEYTKDVNTKIIVDALLLHKPHQVPQDIIQYIKAPCGALVKACLVNLLNDLLVYYKPIMDHRRCIGIFYEGSCLTIITQDQVEVIWESIKFCMV